MIRRPVAALLLLSLATAGSARDRIPAAVTNGKPLACVPLSKLRESIVRSDRIIDFRIARDRYYRVTLPQACPRLGFERQFSYDTPTGQLCAQDTITVLANNPPMPGARCGLAPFQPVRIAR